MLQRIFILLFLLGSFVSAECLLYDQDPNLYCVDLDDAARVSCQLDPGCNLNQHTLPNACSDIPDCNPDNLVRCSATCTQIYEPVC